jgi:hypothetical protein
LKSVFDFLVIQIFLLARELTGREIKLGGSNRRITGGEQMAVGAPERVVLTLEPTGRLLFFLFDLSRVPRVCLDGIFVLVGSGLNSHVLFFDLVVRLALVGGV